MGIVADYPSFWISSETWDRTKWIALTTSLLLRNLPFDFLEFPPLTGQLSVVWPKGARHFQKERWIVLSRLLYAQARGLGGGFGQPAIRVPCFTG